MSSPYLSSAPLANKSQRKGISHHFSFEIQNGASIISSCCLHQTNVVKSSDFLVRQFIFRILLLRTECSRACRHKIYWEVSRHNAWSPFSLSPLAICFAAWRFRLEFERSKTPSEHRRDHTPLSTYKNATADREECVSVPYTRVSARTASIPISILIDFESYWQYFKQQQLQSTPEQWSKTKTRMVHLS